MATETKNVTSQFIYYNGQLLQRQDTSDFISFNIFGEFDHLEDWDAAQEKESVALTTRRELVRSAVKKTSTLLTL